MLTLRHNPPLSYEYSIKIILEKWKDFSFECFINIYELSIIMGFIMTFSRVYKYFDHIYPPLPSFSCPPAILHDPLLLSQWDYRNVSPCSTHSFKSWKCTDIFLLSTLLNALWET